MSKLGSLTFSLIPTSNTEWSCDSNTYEALTHLYTTDDGNGLPWLKWLLL